MSRQSSTLTIVLPPTTTALRTMPARGARRVLHASCWMLLSLAALTPARGESVLAYAKEGEIYTASAADGKNPRKICRGDDPCISNDGRYLAYTRTGAPAARPKGKAQESAPGRAIIVRELATGKETALPAGGANQAYGALWSPDDRWLAFNVYDGKSWQVAVSTPDGAGFRRLTDKLDAKGEGYFLAGWNLHDKGVLAQNLFVTAQIDPTSGEVAWTRPIKEISGEESASSDWHCTISADGTLAISTRYVEDDEFKNLDGPSSYLVLTDFPGGTPKRVTPAKFDVATPWVDLNGESILLRGFAEKDVTTVKGRDGVKVKVRIYRYDLRSGELKPVLEGGEYPTASRS